MEIMSTQGFTFVFLAGLGLFKCYDIGHAVLWRFRITCTSLRQCVVFCRRLMLLVHTVFNRSAIIQA
jgi:hypothetical protein